jgi:hypothetical protein
MHEFLGPWGQRRDRIKQLYQQGAGFQRQRIGKTVTKAGSGLWIKVFRTISTASDVASPKES